MLFYSDLIEGCVSSFIIRFSTTTTRPTKESNYGFGASQDRWATFITVIVVVTVPKWWGGRLHTKPRRRHKSNLQGLFVMLRLCGSAGDSVMVELQLNKRIKVSCSVIGSVGGFFKWNCSPVPFKLKTGYWSDLLNIIQGYINITFTGELILKDLT